MRKHEHIERAATLAAAAAVILGLYAMGAGAWAALGALFLFNLKRRGGGGPTDRGGAEASLSGHDEGGER